MTTLRAYVNPLLFTRIDPAIKNAVDPTANQVIDYLSDDGLQAFLKRYRDIISVETPPLIAAPDERNILEKLVWPLRHAKGNYATGSYLGCIAVCGMVGEMVANLLWEISEKVQLNEAAQRALFGNTFERLRQERRVEVLRALNLIDEKTKNMFDGLRAIRNRYLHVFSHEHTNISGDSRRAYADGFGLVFLVLGHCSFQNGALVLREDLMAYLVKHEGWDEFASSAADGATTEG